MSNVYVECMILEVEYSDKQMHCLFINKVKKDNHALLL